MELDNDALASLVPSLSSVVVLGSYLGYLAIAGLVLPGKLVPGAVLSDGSRLHYCCNGLLSLALLLMLTGTGVYLEWISPTVVADKGIELLSATLIFSLLVSMTLYIVGTKSHNRSASLKPHVTGNFIDDWWFGIQLNPHFMGVDLKYIDSFFSLYNFCGYHEL